MVVVTMMEKEIMMTWIGLTRVCEIQETVHDEIYQMMEM